MMHKIEEDVAIVLPAAQRALARGDIGFIKYELNELLQVFRINLDPNCSDYRKVALAVIKANVRALKDIAARNRGEPIDTPKLLEPLSPRSPTQRRVITAAKEMLRRFGLAVLHGAVAQARYPGLDLSHLHWKPVNKGCHGPEGRAG